MNDFPMRRKALQTDNETALEILKKGSYGIFSTVGSDGFPYGVPVNYFFDGKTIFFHCAKNTGHKELNLENSNKVCFTVVTESTVLPKERDTKYQSVIVFGTAKKVDENTVISVLKELVHKYSSGYIKDGYAEIEKVHKATDIIAITPLKISGKQKHI